MVYEREVASGPAYRQGTKVLILGKVGTAGLPNVLGGKSGIVIASENTKAGMKYTVLVSQRGPMMFYEQDIIRT